MERQTVEPRLNDPMEFDEETGLPTLPDGMAWRVSPLSDTSVLVEIAESFRTQPSWIDRLWGEKPRTIWDSYCFDSRRPCTPSTSAIRDTAVKVYNDVRDWEQARSRKTKLVGLYPPNKLADQ
jgi:hypothetical protein